MATALPTTPVPAAEILAPHELNLAAPMAEQLRPARLPLVVVPFDAAAALDYLHGAYVLSDEDESAIVEAAAIRYGKLPAAEQDGSHQWLIDIEVERFFASAGDDEPSEGERDWMGRSW